MKRVIRPDSDPAAFVRRVRTAALIAALFGSVLLAGCSAERRVVSRGKEYFSEKEYGVKASPRVVAPGQPVPRGGGRYIVGKPYKVKNQWFYPDDPKHVEIGMASWYGSAFHGRLTANGEVYDVNGLTAAHPTMPLPSYARVTNLSNGRSMIVRVNDRGPFLHGRVMDLSQRVAEMLDTRRHGVAKVKVQYIGPARMDGLDERMLLASYDTGGSRSMIASRDRRERAAGVVLASFTPPPPPRPSPERRQVRRPPAASGDPRGIDDLIYGAGEDPVPAVLPEGDPIGRLIGPALVRSYIEEELTTPAHAAIAESFGER